MELFLEVHIRVYVLYTELSLHTSSYIPIILFSSARCFRAEETLATISSLSSFKQKLSPFNNVPSDAAFWKKLFTFFAIHGDLSKIWELFATQIYVVLGSNCVPIPGAIGVADYLMLSGYQELMSKSDAYHLEILSRGLSYYGCMMISMITVLIGYICLRKKEVRRDK